MFPTIRFGHGPDADDAFVFAPLIHGRVDTDGLVFEHGHATFAELNRAARGPRPPEVTMLSAAQFARLGDRYELLPFGGSFVKTMGPTLVARTPRPLASLCGATIALPGRGTTAEMLLLQALPGVRVQQVPYDRVAAHVAQGGADAGVVIHEEQLAFGGHGLVRVLDLGLAWSRAYELPTPLAVCAVRRDLPRAVRERVERVLRRSLDACRADPLACLAYARGFTGSLDADAADVLVDGYVGDDTYALSQRGRDAIDLLVQQTRAGTAPQSADLAVAV